MPFCGFSYNEIHSFLSLILIYMSSYSEKYEIVMGLETHVRVKSHTKMFCSCANALELADEPNINVCPICMGFPGMLPTLSG